MVEVARYITVNMVDVLIACVVKEIPLAEAEAELERLRSL